MKSFRIALGTVLLICIPVWLSWAIWTTQDRTPFLVHAYSLPPAPHDYIAEMKSYARVHHLAYEIFCIDWSTDPDVQFQAEFCDTESGLCKGEFYIEDGGRGWQGAQGPTQAEAARRLLEKVSSVGMNPAKHEEHIPARMRQCPPPIQGKAE